MSFDYQPLLIANLQHGLELGMKPWLAPEEAFVELLNAYLDHGVLYKRKGYGPFSNLVHKVTAEALGTGTGNIVTNPGFETGVLSPWVLTQAGGAAATATVTSGNAYAGTYKCDLAISNAGGAVANLRLTSAALTLVNGAVYKAAIAGKAASARDLQLSIYQNSPSVSELSATFSLTTGWQNFPYNFTAANLTNPSDCYIRILFGAMGLVAFSVDAFTLSRVGWSGTLAHFPVAPGQVAITDGYETFTDDGAGVLTGNHGGTGTINYATGAWAVVFNLPPASAAGITATYSYLPGLPSLGMFNYGTSGGSQDLLAWTTKRVNRYNETLDRFEDLSGADQFTGYDYEYFWFCNWLNKGFMTNGRDQVRVYNGLTVALLVVDLSEPPNGTNDLDSAYLIFPYKDRLIFLRTSEFGTLYPQRARWTDVGFYDQSDPLAWVDAPTHEWIMGATFIKNELVVFFERSVWLLRYTGDSRLPFRWVRVSPNEGLMAKLGLIDFSNEAVGIGTTQLIGTDGVETYSLDDKIPNLVLSMNQAALAYCYASGLDELFQMWMSYPSLGQDLPDKVLVLNYEEKSFSIFTLPHLVTGYYQQNEDLTWDEIEETWDELERAWDDRTLQAGFPVTLGGDHQGQIWKLNSGGSDNGQPIEMSAKLGRWNPFIKKGLKARLGFVDFLVDRDPLCELQVEYFLDHETQPWQTDVLPLDDGSDSDLIWVRSYAGCEAQFHQLRLYNNEVNQSIVVHAIMPWFAPAGRIT